MPHTAAVALVGLAEASALLDRLEREAAFVAPLDGSVGPGAAIRLREFLNGNPRHHVATVSLIEKLDAEGFVHNPLLHGIAGLARMEYRFASVPGGTRFENRLIIGRRRGWRRTVTPWLQRVGFPGERGQAWLRHNIEEVGMLEHILPPLYREETGRED